MTNSPDSENQPEPRTPQRPWLRPLRRTAMVLGVVLLLGTGVGAWQLWLFVHRGLVPLLQKNLSQTINRPLVLGRVEQFSLTSLHFGPSSIPPIPTNPEHASVQAVDVSFDPLQILFTRTLKLNVTLVNPTAYLQQNKDGQWITTTISTEQKPGPIKIQLDTVQLQNADAVLVAYPKRQHRPVPFELARINGTAQLLEPNQLLFSYELSGQPVHGGTVDIQGESRLKTLETNLRVQAQNFLGSDLTHLIKLPLDIYSGRVDGNLRVQLRQNQPQPTLFGTANLYAVTAKFDQLPQPFNNSQGTLTFKGTQIGLEKVLTSYGKVPAIAQGVVDTQGDANLTAHVNGVTLANAQQTLGLKFPVSVTGVVQANLRITGRTLRPILSGDVANIKPVRVDRVDFRVVRSQFVFPTATAVINLKDIQAIPTVGGLITGIGQIKLGANPGLGFNAVAEGIPGDPIARLYGVSPQIKVGTVSAIAQVTGTPTQPQTVVNWQAPQATYPARGEITIAGFNNLLFRNTALKVGGGTVLAQGQLINGRWQATATATDIQLGRLAQVPTELNTPFSGAFNFSGTIGSYTFETITAIGSGQLHNFAGGTITIPSIKLAAGQWQTNIQESGIELARVSPQLQGEVSSQFNAAGTVKSLSLATIRAKGNVLFSKGLAVLSQPLTATVQWDGQKLIIPQAEATGLNANGVILAKVEGAGAPKVTGLDFNILARNYPLSNLPIKLPNSITLGRADFTGRVQAALPNENGNSLGIQNIVLHGFGNVGVAGGTVTANDITAEAGEWQVSGSATGINLGQVLPQLPQQYQGTLRDSRFDLTGSLTAFNLQSIQGTAHGSLNLAGGTITASDIQLAAGQWQALGTANNIHLAQVLPQLPPQFQGTIRDSRFDLTGNLTAFNLQSIRGTAQGSLNLAGGTITASDIQLAAGQWQAIGTANNMQLAQVLPQLPPPLQGTLQSGSFDLLGSLTALNLEAVRGDVSGNLQVAGGTVIANNVQLRDGRFQGAFNTQGVEVSTLAQLPPINRFSPQVQGRVTGNFNASGPFTRFDLADIQASGQLSLLDFAADGLAFNPVLSGTASLVPGQGVNLQLTGGQDQIKVALSPTYRPTSFLIQYKDAIARGSTQGDVLTLHSDNFPLGIVKSVAPLPPIIAVQPVSGTVDSDLQVNLNTLAANGNIAVAKPAIGRFKGDQLTAQFSYANGRGTLTNAHFSQGQGLTQVTLNGSLTPSANGPQLEATANITQGKIQAVLTALQIFDLQDFQRGLQAPTYGTASDVQTVAVGLPQADLFTQLRRLVEVQALVTQEKTARSNASPLPELRDLTGTFGGTITVAGGLKTGVTANLNLQGQDWKWGTYTANQVSAQGAARLANGVLTTLTPVKIALDNTSLSFNGQIGTTQEYGKLIVANFPIGVLQNFVKLPVDIRGNLSASANLAGSLNNPQITNGVVGLTQGVLNPGTPEEKQIQSAQVSFDYTNARLNFNSSAEVMGPPIQAKGSIPYKLPFAEVQPVSNDISLDVNVQNQGLALLNLVTNQIAWQSGQGQVSLQVRGTLDRPLVTGNVTINNATITAQALQEPLTNVTGSANFNLDRITVTGLQGKFSKGQVTAQGEIPIFRSTAAQNNTSNNPLTVVLDKLALNLKGLYQGGVNGNVQITGAALRPALSGQVTLSNGRIFIPQTAATGALASNKAVSSTGTKQNNKATGNSLSNTAIDFNALELILGKAVAVTLPPLLSFDATGELTINGTYDGTVNGLQPDGIITLRSGSVNLFSSEFILARGYPQTATFTPDQGLDPTLDIRLVTNVPEVTQDRLPSSPISSEISQGIDTGVGGALQTVRVQALVQGPASQLSSSLSLTSNPPRSQSEIVTLLGGGFVQTFGRGDTTLGLANLAGSAVLNNFQGTFTKVGNTLGLSDLRIYPSILTNTNARRSSTSTLGLAAEADRDIFGNLSASVVTYLTGNQPTQFGLSYRVNNQIRVRSSTDFTQDTRAVVEYETQF